MNQKQQAAIKAATYIKNNMIVGLGTGSTAYYLVEEISRKIREENFQITGVTTSIKTAKQAESLNIPLKSIDEVDHVDLTIDGADEFTTNFDGIKGGGGALLYEKTVATYSDNYIWIVDSSKQKEHLGAFPLPIEVIPYGHKQLMKMFTKKGLNPKLRLDEKQMPFITDSGHYIIDCHIQKISNPHELANYFNNLTGVVEHGLFLDMVQKIIIGTATGTEILEKTN